MCNVCVIIYQNFSKILIQLQRRQIVEMTHFTQVGI